jgi:hypothetical protein
MTRARTTQGLARCAGPLLALLLTVVALAGCVRPMVEVERLDQVRADEVVVVGRVELVPALKQGEQNITANGPYTDENQLFFFINRKPVAVDDSPERTPYDDVLPAKFGETFYVKSRRLPMHFTVSFIYMAWTAQQIERVWPPGGFSVEPQPNDRAVYIGTIRYHRNEYFDLEKMELVDEYGRERQAFERRFGRGTELVKRLARAARP